MLRRVLVIASVSAVSAACAAHAPPAPKVARIVPKAAKVAVKAPAKPAKEVQEATEPALEHAEADAARTSSALRKVGDFHVYEYTGAFTKKKLTVTEQVIGKEDDLLVVDFVLEEGDDMSAIRVRMHADGEAVKVAKIGADGEEPGTLADYDAFVKKTQFVPDTNDEVEGTEHTSCVVGNEQVECDVTTYKVMVGKKQATLSITRSESVPGRDIGGDVVTKDGKLLYSARLVERGNQPPIVEALAKADPYRFTPAEP
jgi:hypothetical protein